MKKKSALFPAMYVAKCYFCIVICLLLFGAYAKYSKQHYTIPPVAHAQVIKVMPTATPTSTPEETPTQIIKEVWGDAATLGIQIAICESGLDPSKISPPNWDGKYDFGLFQLHDNKIMDGRENAKEALRMFKARGIDPWTSSEHCWGY